MYLLAAKLIKNRVAQDKKYNEKLFDVFVADSLAENFYCKWNRKKKHKRLNIDLLFAWIIVSDNEFLENYFF